LNVCFNAASRGTVSTEVTLRPWRGQFALQTVVSGHYHFLYPAVIAFVRQEFDIKFEFGVKSFRVTLAVAINEMWALEWQFEKGYDRVEVVIAPWHDGLWRLQIAARETSEGLKPYDKFMFHIVVLDLCYDEFHYDQLVTDFITTTQDLSRGKDDAAHD
jgi:hypothetical protein